MRTCSAALRILSEAVLVSTRHQNDNRNNVAEGVTIFGRHCGVQLHTYKVEYHKEC